MGFTYEEEQAENEISICNHVAPERGNAVLEPALNLLERLILSPTEPSLHPRRLVPASLSPV